MLATVFNYRQFFWPAYLLARYPGALSARFVRAWLVGAIIFVVVGIGLKVIPRLHRFGATPPWMRWRRRLGNICLTAGLSAALFLFFRYEQVPFFSSRLWMVLWLAGVLIFLAMLLTVARSRTEREVRLYERQRRLAKYLP